MRRAGILAVIGLFALIVPARAAGDPWRSVSYKAKAGDSSALILAEPTTDLTGASFGFDGTNLRMSATLVSASKTPPLPFAEADYYFRFTVGKVAFYTDYAQFFPPSLNVALSPYTVGVTLAGSDTPGSGQCTSCFGTVDVARGRVEMSIGLDDLNTLAKAASATAPTVRKGTTIKPTEVDSEVGVPGLGPIVITDSALAPKGLSFTLR